MYVNCCDKCKNWASIHYIVTTKQTVYTIKGGLSIGEMPDNLFYCDYCESMVSVTEEKYWDL